ncbi:hypothetical protein DFH29DRAFT_879973 [Suillus ampliporus]|nr:hypothetical protein DFH29DRAFT_879973 [Suillus ampliporus]
MTALTTNNLPRLSLSLSWGCNTRNTFILAGGLTIREGHHREMDFCHRWRKLQRIEGQYHLKGGTINESIKRLSNGTGWEYPNTCGELLTGDASVMGGKLACNASRSKCNPVKQEFGERDSTITTTASQMMTHWDDIQAHYEFHLGGANDNRLHASIVMSTRDMLTKCVTYSRLEGIEVIGCVFNMTPDKAACQASGFVAGSSTFMDIINECQVDACLALDWIVTAANEAPQDCYQCIWPVMVLEKLEQFSYKTKSVQWRKLLDVAYQNKFQFELWPDKVHLVGPDFNYRTLSAQHLKLLVMPYIKCRAKQYYDAKLKMEAENLLKLWCKQGHSDKTLDDIINWLDVLIALFIFMSNLVAPDHIEQCEKHGPKMFDIPLVTSASHIVLWKLADSEKFKYSIPKALLQQYKEATSTSSLNVSGPSGERQCGDMSHDHQSQQQTREHCPAVLQPQRMQPHKRLHVEDYGKSMNHSLADPLLIEFLADDQQFESEADSLNAPDSRIRKKSKVIRYHDGAPCIELPSQCFVPA